MPEKMTCSGILAKFKSGKAFDFYETCSQNFLITPQIYTDDSSEEELCNTFFLFHSPPPLADIHLLPRLKDPPSRVKRYYHHPFFILTMMLRQTSALIKEREKEGGRQQSNKEIRPENTQKRPPSGPQITLLSLRWKTCFPWASKHNYASKHTLSRSFSSKSSPSLITVCAV